MMTLSMQRSTGIASRSSLLFRPRRYCGRRRRRPFKNTTLCFGGKFGEERRRSHERVLRYPNGDIRLIRYPATESETEPEPTADTKPDRDEHSKSFPKTNDLPSSPAELIRLIRSSSYIQAQNEHRRRIQESYEIHETHPWKVPKEVYVLAVDDGTGEASRMYTIRTRLHQGLVTRKLTKMFRGSNFEGDFIRVDRLADGVITFLDQENAERFKSLVEAEEAQTVEVCEMTSQKLFENTVAVKAVAVLMRMNDYCPSLEELMSSLKARESLD